MSRAPVVDRTFKGMPTWVGKLYNCARKNAESRGIAFSVSRKAFKSLVEASGSRCALSGIEFDTSPANGKRRPFAPSLDRIDSRKGYSLSNCRLVCVIVNLAMNEWGADALLRLARNLVIREAELRERGTLQGKHRPPNFLTIAEFCSNNILDLTKAQRSALGRRVNGHCVRNGVSTIRVPNIRTDGTPGKGGVLAYPESVLSEIQRGSA